MIILDSTTKSVDVSLAGTVTTNALQWVSSWVDMDSTTFVPGSLSGTLSTGSVETIPAPASSHQRQAKFISIYNADTVAQTVNVVYNDNASLRSITKIVLESLETLQYIDSDGFAVIKASGEIKSGNMGLQGATGPQGPQGTAGSTGTTGATGVNEISIIAAASDETTAITTGTSKTSFRTPDAFTLSYIRTSLTTAQTSGTIFTVNVKMNGTTVFSTKSTIDNTETTSYTAATPSVLSVTSIPVDALWTIDVDQIGDGTAKGLKVTLKGIV